MRLISLNAGSKVTVEYQGKTVTTGIFKKPVDQPLKLGKDQIQSDHIDNLEVHGGYHKAIYAYPMEHYKFWKERYAHMDFEYGMFGENLTVEGLLESEVYAGDLLHIGDCILEVSEPRQPCFKLGIKFQDPGIIKPFLQSGTTGFYLRIIEAGTLPTQGVIKLVPGPRRFSIAQLNNVVQGMPFQVEWNPSEQTPELSVKWQKRLLSKML